MNNGEVRIHCETIGEARPLVLHHGTSFCEADWIDIGYVDALQIGRQLILIDREATAEATNLTSRRHMICRCAPPTQSRSSIISAIAKPTSSDTARRLGWIRYGQVFA